VQVYKAPAATITGRAVGDDGLVAYVAHDQTTDAAVVDGLLGASRVLVALAARSVAQLGVEVTLVQNRALVVLASRGPQRTVDLADELRVAPSTVTRMVDRLTAKDLVRRYRRRDDRRATWVILTVRGRDLVGEVMRHRRDAIADLVKQAPVTDPSALATALQAFVEVAGEVPDPLWWERWRVSADLDPDALPG
jgi:DNA-binding MarR family transcriptional regulator